MFPLLHYHALSLGFPHGVVEKGDVTFSSCVDLKYCMDIEHSRVWQGYFCSKSGEYFEEGDFPTQMGVASTTASVPIL